MQNLVQFKFEMLTAPWISHVCNGQQVSYALLEIFMCSSDTCTMSLNSCLLYYITKFLEIQMEIISFLLR